MSWNTRWLVRASNAARKAGNQAEVDRLGALIRAVEDRCPHPADVRGSSRVPKDSVNGKYKKGGLLHFCLLCGKPTQYDPPTHGV